MSGNVIRLAVNNPLVTYEQLRDQEFEPKAVFSTREWMNTHEHMLTKLGMFSRAAFITLTFNKAELIEQVKKIDKTEGKEASAHVLAAFTEGIEIAKELLDFIRAAEIRHAIAMANIYEK
jgi:hypothetical protein